ncbi:MAG: hypothetical protein ACI9BV_003992, partial [Rhodothermales bacterium]
MRSLLFLVIILGSTALESTAQEARRRWEMMNQIRRDKFDLVLPEAMRENGIDMWIVMNREGNNDPLWADLGGGYTGGTSYYVFSDPGDGRVERAALGVSGYLLKEGDAYDYFGGSGELAEFVTERDPARIGINTSQAIG